MTKLDYDLLKFFFEMRADVKLFKSEKIGEKININLPLSAYERYVALDKLIHKGYLRISNRNRIPLQGVNIGEIINDANKHYLEITEYGGATVEKLLDVHWDRYCNFAFKPIDDKTYHIIIEMHPNMKSDVIKLIGNIIDKYHCKEIKPWYPVYWKKIEKGTAIDFNISVEDYWNFLDKNIDKICNCLWKDV